jgi:lysophospholipase L1-like esterase
MNEKRIGLRLVRGVGVAAVIISGLAALAGLGEVAVRRFLPQEHLPPDLFVADKNLGYRVARNYRGEYVTRHFSVPIVTNSLGLRDREYGPPADGGVRLYILGDSFIFGNRVPVEDTVTKVLERQLQERLQPRPVEVVNGGLPGYSTIQELKFFEETVDVLQPDLVLVGICLGNDIWDNLLYTTRNAAEGGGGAWRAGGGGLRAKLTLLLKRSDLYLLVRRTFNQTFRGSERQEANDAARPRQLIGEAVRLTEDAVAGLAAATRRRGIGFAVLLITVPERVIPVAQQQELNHRFLAFAAERGIAVYDLAANIEDEGTEALYYTVHWTPYGHEVVAAAITEFLLDSGLLSTPGAIVQKAESDGHARGGEGAKAF